MTASFKEIVYDDMKVSLRKDFYGRFDHLLKELFDDTGVTFFSHNLITNYRQENHTISSFGSNELWNETYWAKFRNTDPVERACHSATQQVGIGLSSWQVIDPTSECTHQRTEICKVRDGVLIAFQHSDGLIENISFGWTKFDTNSLNTEKIELLNKIIIPLRHHHLTVSGLDNSKSSAEKQ